MNSDQLTSINSQLSIDRYLSYKDSGVEWLGEIPEHWNVKRVKDVFQERSGYGFPHDEQGDVNGTIPFYKVSDINANDWFVRKSKNYVTPETVAKHRWKIVPENTIITAKIGEALKKNHRKITLSDCLIDNNCLGLLPLSTNIKFAYYLLKIIDFDRFTNTGAVPSVSTSGIRGFLISCPSMLEQEAIANYLDTKTAQIDRKIELLSQKAGKYGKLKQSLINETVTRGLDKSMPMKSSGIEWIGDVPAHWEVKRVKEISKVVNGATPKSSVVENWEGELPWVTTDDLGKLNSKYITDTKRKLTSIGYSSCGTTTCPIGSVVISGRAPIGHIGVLSIEACSNQGCKTLVINQKVVSNWFLYYCLLSSKPKLEALGRGTTFIELSTKELELFKLPLPPLSEQESIADYLGDKTTEIELIIKTINNQINNLKELRKTLINDVVTGKIKVVE